MATTPVPPVQLARDPFVVGNIYYQSSNSCYPDQRQQQINAGNYAFIQQVQQQEQAFAAQEAASPAAQAAQHGLNAGLPPLP